MLEFFKLRIFAEFIGKFVQVYLDDIIIYSRSQAEHIQHIEIVLNRFVEVGILLNPNKCILAKKQIDYVGYTISSKGWRPQPRKLEAIKEFPEPKNKKEAKRFCGMLAFYTDACPMLQVTLDPIHKISGLKSEFIWGEKQETAFVRAKELLLKCVTMAYPSQDPRHTLYLTTDASDLGIGGTLSQLGPDSIERPIGFFSRTFKKSQINWVTRTKEAYTLYKSLEYFYVYLFDRYFVWRTDNLGLSFLKSGSQSSSNRV